MKVLGMRPAGQLGLQRLAWSLAEGLLVISAGLATGCGGGGPDVSDSGADASIDAPELDTSVNEDGDLADADTSLRFTFWHPAGIWHAPRSVNIEAVAEGGVPPYVYAWTPADRFPNSEFEIFRDEEVPGEYETCVTVTDSIGAAVSDCLVLEAFPTPRATLDDLPAQVCVQDSPLVITFEDNLVEGTAPNTRYLVRVRVEGERLPHVTNPVSPFSWTLDATTIGDWEITYDVADSSGEYFADSETISIVDCP